MIAAKNISYRIHGKDLLHTMSFTAHPGAVTVLLGANGAGKSTLLRVLAGEYTPHTGEVLLAGRPLKDFPPQVLARKRAVLTQNYSVPLPFTCEEIVMMGRYPHESTSTGKENEAIAARCMKEMEVQHFSRRMFSTLSGGEQQRVQMARVLAQLETAKGGEEKIVLLDEPTSSLDYLQQQLILSRARSLASKGYTVIMVLHDLNLAAQYADKIFLLKEGRLLAEGQANEVLRPPLISAAYGVEVDVVEHENYPFPILVPALHNQNRILQINKIHRYGSYSSKAVVE